MTRMLAFVLLAGLLHSQLQAQDKPQSEQVEGRFALGLTLDATFADQSDALFVKDGPLLSYGVLLSYDLPMLESESGPIIVALHVGGRMRQYSATDLFGGAVTTAISTYQPYLGSSVRMFSSSGPDPHFSYHARIGVGASLGSLELRDVRQGGGEQRHINAAPFLDLSLGVTIRLLNLLVEVGHTWASTRSFEAAASQDRVVVEEGGVFVRLAMLLRP